MKRHRAEVLIDILKPLNPKIGAEVGVDKAETSTRLLTAYSDMTLYLIDKWTGRTYRPSEKIAMRVLEPFGKRAIVLKGDSVAMANEIKDGSLDFVFIDAKHDEEPVRADMDAWYPKVRSGGYVLGHDYLSPFHPGVKKAVDDYFKDRVKVFSDGAGQDFPARGAYGVECGIWMVIK